MASGAGDAPRVLVVGGGLAGLLTVETLERRSGVQAVVWAAPESQHPAASQVAAGMFNPVSFRRLLPVWEAERHMALAEEIYRGLEERLGVGLWHEVSLFKRFPNQDYADLWAERLQTDHPVSPWIESKDWRETKSLGQMPFGGGWVPRAGYVDLKNLISGFRAELEACDRWETREWFLSDGLPEGFDLVVDARGVGAKSDLATFGLDLRPNHGEVLTLDPPDGSAWPDALLNHKKWLLPLADGRRYRLGATYRWDLTEPVTHEAARTELIGVMKELRPDLAFDDVVTDHSAGIRPASPDRRPMVGQPDPEGRPWYHLINGLGTRGVLVGPRAAAEFHSTFVEKTQAVVDSELVCQRFRTFKAR